MKDFLAELGLSPVVVAEGLLDFAVEYTVIQGCIDSVAVDFANNIGSVAADIAGCIDSADFGIADHTGSVDSGTAYLFDSADPNYFVAFRSGAAVVVHQVSLCDVLLRYNPKPAAYLVRIVFHSHGFYRFAVASHLKRPPYRK